MSGQLVAGRYRVVRRIGAGGMASVLLGEDELLGRQVALKRLHPFGTDELVARLEREARIGAALNHPNIVRVFDVIGGDDGVWVVMEYVEGESLADLVGRAALPPSQALAILRAVASALDHVHERGYVHRDVKPANVLLGADGRVKLTDLGIATALDATRLTQSGSALGSAAYMAPEQFDARPATPAVDVHALAAVAFELLAGRRAREAASPAAVVGQIAEGVVPDLRDAWSDAPPAAADVLRRGMAPDPAQRPASAGALVDELATALRAAEPAPPPEPEPEPEPTAPVAAVAPDRAPAPARTPTSGPARRPRPAPVPVSERRPGAARWLVPLALALLVLGVGAAALVGGDDEPADRAATAPAAGTGDEPVTTTATTAPGGGTATATTPSGGDTAGGGSGGGAVATDAPAQAVEALYSAAARQDTAGVCARVTERFKQMFSCPGTFTTQFGTLRDVEFGRLEVTQAGGDSATVALATTARHTNRTDRCEGTAALVREDGRWLLDALNVAC